MVGERGVPSRGVAGVKETFVLQTRKSCRKCLSRPRKTSKCLTKNIQLRIYCMYAAKYCYAYYNITLYVRPHNSISSVICSVKYLHSEKMEGLRKKRRNDAFAESYSFSGPLKRTGCPSPSSRREWNERLTHTYSGIL